jgi:hypothetical protein
MKALNKIYPELTGSKIPLMEVSLVFILFPIAPNCFC